MFSTLSSISQEANPGTLVNQLCLNRNHRGACTACIWTDRKKLQVCFFRWFLFRIPMWKKQPNSCMYARSAGRWIDFQKPTGNSKGLSEEVPFFRQRSRKKRCGSARVTGQSKALEAAMVTMCSLLPCLRYFSWLLKSRFKNQKVQLASISILHRVKSVIMSLLGKISGQPSN